MAQLPLVVVCEVADCDDDELDDELDDVVALDVFELLELDVVAVVDEVASSDSESPELVLVLVVAVLLLVAAEAACVAVVLLRPSRHASTPPSESMLATLSAVAALRARAARGLRRVRLAPARGGGATGVGEAVGSSMTVNLRTGGEATSRAE
jgi:hypothetical protein